MSVEANKDTMRRFLDATIGSDPAVLKALLAPDFVAHLAGGPKDGDGFVAHNSHFITSFSDREIRVADLIAEGDTVVARITWTGVHTGDFMGLPPSGKRIVLGAYVTERFRDGQSVEHRSLFDQLALQQQLGLAMPPPPRT